MKLTIRDIKAEVGMLRLHQSKLSFPLQVCDSHGKDRDATINAQYRIDQNRNNGLDFQYDAVVRNRQERRQLDAGDCECCRDVSDVLFINANVSLSTV